MKPILVILSLLSSLAVSLANIIPTDRITTWQGNVGVPNGIPPRPIPDNLCTTDQCIALSTIDHTADATNAIRAAINSCPEGKVVYVPAGEYLLNDRILIERNNFTLRGAGMGKTVLAFHDLAAYNGAFNVGRSEWPPSTIDANITITNGATAGSTTVTCNDVSAVVPNKLIRIEQTDLSWVKPLNGATHVMSYIFRVTNKDAVNKTVTFSPPLPFTLTNSPKMGVYPNYLTEGVGFEDLTIELQNATSIASAVFVEQAYGCWFKNIEIAHSSHRQIWFSVAMNCEVRHCYTHDALATGNNHEGIDLQNAACWNLIEDNVCVRGGYPMIVLGDYASGAQIGANSGNVIAYNYCEDSQSDASTIAGSAISDNHGPHNMMNLYEGNVAQMFESDGYYGSSSHGTVFRNWFSGKYSASFPYIWVALKLDHYANYYNIVGNILGDSSVSSTYDTEVNSYSGTLALIYRLGYPFMGSTEYQCDTNNVCTIPQATPAPVYTNEPVDIHTSPQKLDLNVKATILRHGNYDYATTPGPAGIKWDPNITDQNLPNSYYLLSKPGYFGGLAWPAIDPLNTVTAVNTSIPAGYRHVHHIDPPSAVSRKVHGSAGTFDIALPLNGLPGIECRSGGASQAFQIVVTFQTPIDSASATVTGTGSGTASVSGNVVTVDLTGVTDQQTITVTLNGTSNGNNFDVAIPMGMLIGDVTASRVVNSSDITQIGTQSGQPLTNSNFRNDVTVNGTINSSDVTLTQTKSGHALP
jgi:hypothetical protein